MATSASMTRLSNYLEKSLKFRFELAAAHPSVTKFRENLGENYEVIADIQHKAHQDDKAFSSLQKSIDILEKLAQSHPEQREASRVARSELERPGLSSRRAASQPGGDPRI